MKRKKIEIEWRGSKEERSIVRDIGKDMKSIYFTEKIDECCNRGESSGRQKLLEVCKQQEIFLTEQEIRGMLKN